MSLEKRGAGVLKAPNPTRQAHPEVVEPGEGDTRDVPASRLDRHTLPTPQVLFRTARLLGGRLWDAVAWEQLAPSCTQGPANTSPRVRASSTHPADSQPSLASLAPGEHALVAWGCLGGEFQGPGHLQQDLEG